MRRAVGPHTDCCCCCIPVKSSTVYLTPLQHSHRPRPSFSQATHELSGACCSRCCELVDTHALSTHRSIGYSFIAIFRYWLIRESHNFCHIFSRGNGGQLIRGTAYMRVYMVCFLFIILIYSCYFHDHISKPFHWSSSPTSQLLTSFATSIMKKLLTMFELLNS